MAEVIIEQAVKILGAFFLMLISVIGTWLSSKLAKHIEVKSIAVAVETLTSMAAQTVGELEQTMVKGLKDAHADGKLTEEEITQLGMMLYNITIKKMSKPMMELLEAASVDIQAIITSAGEDWINELRSSVQ